MKKIIHSDSAAAPIGPYSQAVMHNNTLYVSGQIALSPESGEVVIGDIKEETSMVLKNMQAILSAADLNFANVVKCSIFLSDMNHFNEMNEVYSKVFNDSLPARECIAVKTLPKNVNVEISCIAASA